jgi:2-oxoglutarate dehydrogenase E1 component
LFERLAYSVRFETILATKFNTAKRFGLEGVEAMVPGMKVLVDCATEAGVEDIIIGMPHRGRLNVLGNVVRKPMEIIFKEFKGIAEADKLDQDGDEDWSCSGDVKYHLGTSFDRKYPDGRQVHLALLPNPSHLEAVNPLVVGRSKARMHLKGDEEGKKILPVIIHGDAAFAGQGVVYETMQMAEIDFFQTGGSINIICNNQIGFTANPEQGRSTMYSSDLGKAFGCPIFHVNADDVEAVSRVFTLAAEWRNKFHTDVVVDIIGYRKNGHNEIDEPHFTHPTMYQKISKHPDALTVYTKQLLDEGSLTQQEVDEVLADVDRVFNEG